MKRFRILIIAIALFSACKNHSKNLSYDSKPEITKVEEEFIASPHGIKPTLEKLELSVSPVKDGITISEIYANKKEYDGKTVKIKGIVTKFYSEIMGKNWIHIQDGTAHKDKYDLTATSIEHMHVGDTVILQGKLKLNKDLGAGYFFEVLLEDCKIHK